MRTCKYAMMLSLAVILVLSACGDESDSSSSNGDSRATKAIGTMTDSRDGQTYKTVKIGTQTWMAENLNFKTDGSFCYNNEESNCAKYGRLYTWAEAVGLVNLYDKDSGVYCGFDSACTSPNSVYGVCPLGWHLPTQAEWDTLFLAVGNVRIAGMVLKSSLGWNENGNGADAFGFSALPAGSWLNDGFGNEGYFASFWSSTGDDRSACGMYLFYDRDGADLDYYNKDNRFSVRCLKDDVEKEPITDMK